MFKLIRWVLLAPLTVFTWLIVFASVLALHSTLDTYCPAAFKVSGACTWKWAMFAQDALLIVGASLSAILVVLVATLVAPTHKPRVAIFTYIIGLAVAAWMCTETDAIAAFVGAAFWGFITAWIAFRRLSRRPSLGDGYQRRLFA